jgi:hypothetical protein
LEKEKEKLNIDKTRYESQISLIKTQREYEAITSEIAQIQEKLEAINEEQTNALVEIEEVKKNLEEQKELHTELKNTPLLHQCGHPLIFLIPWINGCGRIPGCPFGGDHGVP